MNFSEIHPGGDYVKRDWTDLRDRPYAPSLAVLKSAVIPDRAMLREIEQHTELVFGVRQQGQTGRCVGYALAALIDLQRCHQAMREGGALDGDDEIVSADMLYSMAVFHELYADQNAPVAAGEPPAAREGVRSLRSVIKGFYHHGVCFDMRGTCPDEEAQRRWQSQCYMAQPVAAKTELARFPTVAQAKAARAIGLGAYFRVEPLLNHFHAALNEVGAILVSANVHTGWYKATKGEIPFDNEDEIGTHAFVLVGYDEDGFLALNSWGPEWGGYQRRGIKTGLAGIARWHYADWAQNIVDAWVLRLGVSAPSAFDKSIGEQGALRIYGQVESRTPPCFELVGHFIHLDDGRFVDFGAYPSFPQVWRKTEEHLETALVKDSADTGASRYDGVLVWIPGSLEGIKSAFDLAAQRKNEIKSLGLYPYSIFWCSRFVDKSMEVLGTIFQSCEEQAGEDQEHLDLLIEDSISGIGRAFWRDLERGADVAVLAPANGSRPAAPGPAGALILDILELCERTGGKLHLVVEGAGALLLDKLIASLPELQRMRRAAREAEGKAVSESSPALEAHLKTLSLVMPAIGLAQAGQNILPLVAKMNGRKARKACPVPGFDPVKQRLIEPDSTGEPLPARIYIPDRDLETRIGFSAYGKTILHLVASAFADRVPPDGERSNPQEPPSEVSWRKDVPQTLLGMYEAAAKSPRNTRSAFSLMHRVSDPRYATGKVPQTALSSDPSVPAEIFRTIRNLCKSNS